MFENIINFFKNIVKKDNKEKGTASSKDAAKERLHLVLMQDRANVSADFLELMKQEIIDVIKKYIEIDEKEIDVRLTNKENEDGTNGAPALYANIPILNIKNETRKIDKKEVEDKQKRKVEQKQNKEDKEKVEQKENKEKENKEKIEEVKQEDKEKEVQHIIKESEEIIEESIKVEEQKQEDKEPIEENEESIEKIEKEEVKSEN